MVRMAGAESVVKPHAGTASRHFSAHATSSASVPGSPKTSRDEPMGCGQHVAQGSAPCTAGKDRASCKLFSVSGVVRRDA